MKLINKWLLPKLPRRDTDAIESHILAQQVQKVHIFVQLIRISDK